MKLKYKKNKVFKPQVPNPSLTFFLRKKKKKKKTVNDNSLMIKSGYDTSI
jgi:hypothetical protein